MTTSSQKSDAELLMKQLLPLAKKLLAECREFYPYGGALLADRSILSIGAEAATDRPASREVIGILEESMRKIARERDVLVFGVVADTALTKRADLPADGIRVSLNHAGGYSVNVYFPYSFSDKGDLIVHAPQAASGTLAIFDAAC
jgi:hypothetical protein